MANMTSATAGYLGKSRYKVLHRDRENRVSYGDCAVHGGATVQPQGEHRAGYARRDSSVDLAAASGAPTDE